MIRSTKTNEVCKHCNSNYVEVWTKLPHIDDYHYECNCDDYKTYILPKNYKEKNNDTL